jgi:hypothetical protein
MTTLTFDTDRLVEDLKTSGIPHDQARAIVRGMVEAQTELATQRDIAELSRSLDARLIQLEQRLIIKLGALVTLAIGVVAVLVKLL